MTGNLFHKAIIGTMPYLPRGLVWRFSRRYIAGTTLADAYGAVQALNDIGCTGTIDVLGEDITNKEQVAAALILYREALDGIRDNGLDCGISVKLSALHPRFEFAQRERVLRELTPKLLELAQLARANRIALTVDTEEADRLMLTLDVFAEVLADASLKGWDGLGLALQAYQRRAFAVIDWLAEQAARCGRRIPVRLVKGAYWDSEIKHAQVEGLDGYPVFTRKANTDVSYIACARKLLANRAAFYPQFATHNAHTIAAVTELAGDRLDYEFQRLHGMGRDLYGVVMQEPGFRHACRVYAPVGSHEDLLPYLVRRLLENGSNTSFVNKIADESIEIEDIVADPLETAASHDYAAHDRIPAPNDIFQPERINSHGINLPNRSVSKQLLEELEAASSKAITAKGNRRR